MAIDEMMVKSYARTTLKQFIREKSIRFGLKFWGLYTTDGYLLDLNLYCGKNSTIVDQKLQSAKVAKVSFRFLSCNELIASIFFYSSISKKSCLSSLFY